MRKFAAEQYAATGLSLHPGLVPTEVTKQPDGRLTVVFKDADGNKVEMQDNDQVGRKFTLGISQCAAFPGEFTVLAARGC